MRHAPLAFPAGPTGGGLLLLRASVALLLAAAAFEAPVLQGARALPVYALALAIGLGVSARIASTAGAAGLLALAIADRQPWPPTLGHVLAGAALAVLGPGAFSVDGFLFGRRTLRLGGGPPPIV